MQFLKHPLNGELLRSLTNQQRSLEILHTCLLFLLSFDWSSAALEQHTFTYIPQKIILSLNTEAKTKIQDYIILLFAVTWIIICIWDNYLLSAAVSEKINNIYLPLFAFWNTFTKLTNLRKRWTHDTSNSSKYFAKSWKLIRVWFFTDSWCCPISNMIVMSNITKSCRID